MHKMTKLVLGVAAAGVLLAGTVTFVGATSGSGMERGAQVKAGGIDTAKLGSGAVDTLKLALNVIDTRKLLLHDVIDTGKILCVKESDHNIHAATPAQWAAGLCP